MKRAELRQTIMNVLARGGQEVKEDAGTILLKSGDNWLQINGLEGIARTAAAFAFIRNLTEDDDTRRLRWQYGDLVDKGSFTLED